MDDSSLADRTGVVLENFKTLIEMPNKIGLQINLTECKLFSISGKVDNDVLNKFNEVSLGIKVATKENLELLAAPIFK